MNKIFVSLIVITVVLQLSLEIGSFLSSKSSFSNGFGYSRSCGFLINFRIWLPISLKRHGCILIGFA